jgi:hypothetical protein
LIVAARAEAGTLPDAAIQGGTLSITPIKDETPEAATAMSRLVYGQLPQIKIPDLLTEVNAWTGFAECFTHYRSGRPAEDQKALFAAVLADGVNLSVSRMAAATHNLTAGRSHGLMTGICVRKHIQAPWPVWSTCTAISRWPNSGGTV